VGRMPVFRKRYISFALAAGLLFLFFDKAEWRVMLSELKTAEWALLAVAVVIRFICLLSASLRWQVLLLPVKRVALAPLFSAMMIGISADTLVAMQSAEVIRPYLLSRWENIPFGSTFATVMVEWLVDLLAVVTFLIASMMALRTSAAGDSSFQLAKLDRVVLAVLVGSLVGLGLLWLLGWHANGIERFFSKRSLREVPTHRFARWMKSFGQGLEVVQRPKRLVEVFGYSLLSSFLVGLTSWVVLKAFGLSLPFFASFILVGFIAVGGMLPTPGAVGGFHAACQFGLAVYFQIEPARTILPVVGLHAVLYIPPTLVGLFFVGRENLTLRKIQEGGAAASLGGQ
jgi:uncharacterized protein (TIRG00374 family)